MNKKEKPEIDFEIEKQFELNFPEFFKELNKAISTNNIESIYKLSKIYTRYQFKQLNN